MLYAFFGIVDMILQLLVWIIIAQAIISWLVAFNVINTSSNFVRTLLTGLDRLTAPMYRPIRKILPDFGGIDFSPIVLILAIQIVRKLLEGLALETSATLMARIRTIGEKSMPPKSGNILRIGRYIGAVSRSSPVSRVRTKFDEVLMTLNATSQLMMAWAMMIHTSNWRIMSMIPKKA